MKNISTSKNNAVLKFTVSLLSALSKSGGGIQELLEIGYKVLNNPIIVADKSWRSVAMTPNIKIPGDISWNDFLKNRFLSPETIASNIRDQVIEKIDTNKTPFKLLSADMKYPRLIDSIMLNNKQIAIISVLEYNRKIRESDYELVKILCNALATEFQKKMYQQQKRGIQHEDLFVNILKGKFKDKDQISEELEALRLRINKYKYVVIFDIIDSVNNRISASYLCGTVEEMIIDGKAFIYNDHVVLVAHFTTENRINAVIAPLVGFLDKLNIRCGISRCFEQFADLHLHYDQAINALSVGQRMDIKKQIYYYSEYAIYHMTKISWDASSADSFIHPAIRTLIMFDEEHKTDFVNTLNVYLKNFGNITNMSKALNMHRNTSIYRIQRIESIMNISLSDYNTMGQIIYSLRLIEYQKRSPEL